MKSWSKLNEDLNEWAGNIHDSHVSDDDVYEFARHVDHHAQKHNLSRYPDKDKDGNELQWGSSEHKKNFFGSALSHESHRRALRELQSHHRATGTVPSKAPKDLARRTWHGAAVQHAAANPDWKKKTNSFKGNRGEEVKLSKEANIAAGPTKKGLDSAMVKAGIHSKSRAEYHNIDHETDKKLVGGYASFAKNRYAKYRKFPGQK